MKKQLDKNLIKYAKKQMNEINKIKDENVRNIMAVNLMFAVHLSCYMIVDNNVEFESGGVIKP